MRSLGVVLFVVVALAAATSGTAAAPPPHRTISAEGFPISIAAADGSLWVLTHRSTLLDRIDPARNRITARVDLSESLCWYPTYYRGSLWVANCEGEGGGGRVYRVDPGSGAVVGHVPGGAPAAGDGSVWTVDLAGRLRRIDPRSGVVLATIQLRGLNDQGPNGDPWVGGVAYGSVWVGSCTTVVRVSTATNRQTATIHLHDHGCPQGIVGDGYLGGQRMAFAHRQAILVAPTSLYSIRASTNAAKKLPVPVEPYTQWGDSIVELARGNIWVRVSDALVARIDPVTWKTLRTYPAGGGGGGFAIAFGSLWVVNAANDTVWREPL